MHDREKQHWMPGWISYVCLNCGMEVFEVTEAIHALPCEPKGTDRG